MGHRGAKGEYPENTLGSFKYAFSHNVQAIELDVHASLDGAIVVIHDDTLERTTNGSGLVKNKTLDELKKLDAGQGEQIPTLEEVIYLLKDHPHIECQVELKVEGIEKDVIELVTRHQMQQQMSLISFNHRSLLKAKEINPKIKTYPLMYGLPTDPCILTNPIQADGVSLSIHTIDEKFIKDAHQAGLKVTVWNVNNQEDFQKFKNWQVDYMGTDYPSKIGK